MTRLSPLGSMAARLRTAFGAHAAMTHCARCGTAARVRVGACPLCGERLAQADAGRLMSWRRRGVLEVSVVAVVAAVLVVTWTVVFLHR